MTLPLTPFLPPGCTPQPLELSSSARPSAGRAPRIGGPLDAKILLPIASGGAMVRVTGNGSGTAALRRVFENSHDIAPLGPFQRAGLAEARAVI